MRVFLCDRRANDCVVSCSTCDTTRRIWGHGTPWDTLRMTPPVTSRFAITYGIRRTGASGTAIRARTSSARACGRGRTDFLDAYRNFVAPGVFGSVAMLDRQELQAGSRVGLSILSAATETRPWNRCTRYCRSHLHVARSFTTILQRRHVVSVMTERSQIAYGRVVWKFAAPHAPACPAGDLQTRCFQIRTGAPSTTAKRLIHLLIRRLRGFARPLFGRPQRSALVPRVFRASSHRHHRCPYGEPTPGGRRHPGR